jgi:hypothetical protein
MQSIKIDEICVKDLELMQSILDKMKKGIDMNLLAFWSPDQIYNSDSCPAGLGSYSDQGFAWGFAIPDDLLFRVSNNLLEFLLAVITPWIDIIHGHLTAGDCALSMTDSTPAEGWMRKSNFVEPNEHPVQAKTRVDAVRKYASIFMDADIKGYSQWSEGKRNNVADALSRDWHLGNDKLTSLLRSHFPEQMPESFRISPPPKEISSWLTSLLQQLPVSEQLRERHTTTGLALGDDGKNGASLLDATTSILISSARSSKIIYSVPLQWPSEKDGSRSIATLVEGTVRGAISHVVQAFRESGRQNPTKDADNMLSVLLSRQSRAYRNDDPKAVQQKALPFIVIEELAKRRVSELDRGVSQITICAGFFACRSCEYLKVPRREMKRTKLLCLRNIRFFKNGRLLSTPSANLEFADSVAVTFEMQKNEEKHETIIHGRTDDPVLCPVKQWALLVNWIWSYQGTTENTPVCTVWRHDRRKQITSRQVITSLRAACATIGSARLGFEPY